MHFAYFILSILLFCLPRCNLWYFVLFRRVLGRVLLCIHHAASRYYIKNLKKIYAVARMHYKNCPKTHPNKKKYHNFCYTTKQNTFIWKSGACECRSFELWLDTNAASFSLKYFLRFEKFSKRFSNKLKYTVKAQDNIDNIAANTILKSFKVVFHYKMKKGFVPSELII